MELVNVIESIQRSLKYDNINRGGCVHFAYFMSQQLTTYKIKHRIIAFQYKESKLLDLEEGCSHIVLHIPEIGYIDAKQTSLVLDRFGYKYCISRKIPKTLDLNKIRLNKWAWNCSYNRKYNGTMSRVINSAFKKLKNDNRRSRL